MHGNDLADAVEQCLEALRQGLLWVGTDAAAGDIGESASDFVDDAESGHPQARVDAEDAQRSGVQFVRRKARKSERGKIFIPPV
jgi:hypothetical protein